jgi:hypothetical protein
MKLARRLQGNENDLYEQSGKCIFMEVILQLLKSYLS